jgi:hypothetical protein
MSAPNGCARMPPEPIAAPDWNEALSREAHFASTLAVQTPDGQLRRLGNSELDLLATWAGLGGSVELLRQLLPRLVSQRSGRGTEELRDPECSWSLPPFQGQAQHDG